MRVSLLTGSSLNAVDRKRIDAGRAGCRNHSPRVLLPPVPVPARRGTGGSLAHKSPPQGQVASSRAARRPLHTAACCGVFPRVFGAPRRPVSSNLPNRRWSPSLRTGPMRSHEVKHDGYRLIARKEAGRVTLWSRYGTDFTDKLPRIVEAVRSLPVDDALLDGEAVVFRPDGHSDFGALRTKHGAAQAALVAFDLLHLAGVDRRTQPLEARRADLGSLVAGIDAIMFSEAIEEDGDLVFAKACELGVEGIVSKRLGGVYLSGPCRNWLKVKNPAFLRG